MTKLSPEEQKAAQEARAKRAEEKRAARAEYVARKKDVCKREKDNNRYVYFFQCDDKHWFKVGWNSLLIYRFVVAKRLKKTVRVRNDGDFGTKSPTGIVSLRDSGVDSVIEELKPLKMFEVRGLPKGIKAIDLGYTVTDEDLERFRHMEEILKQRLNELVQVGPTMPELEAKLAEIMKVAHQTVRAMSRTDQEIFGKEMIEYVVKAMKYYRRMAWNGLDPEVALRKVYMEVCGLMLHVNVLGRSDMMELAQAARIGEYALDARNMLRRRLGQPAATAAKQVQQAVDMKTARRSEDDK